MDRIILTCCGEEVATPPKEVMCPSCGTRFTEAQVDDLQTRELTSIPVVDVLRVTKMLNQPAAWITDHLRDLGAYYGFPGRDLLVFPVVSIRRFAMEHSLVVNPRPIDNGVLWAPKARA